MGSVWRAEHVELGTPAAVKLIDQAIAENPEALARFKREAQAAAALRSINVVQIFDYGIDDGEPYIAMELLEGESLADRVHRDQVLDPEHVGWLLSQVGKALGRAHEMGIVHRDLKPDNIFIARDVDEEVVKVLDFGIAKSVAAGQTTGALQTRTGAVLGTPHYMSPEQTTGKSSVDHRTDIWALAVIAFECVTGRRPFSGETLGGLAVSICTGPMPRPSEVCPVPPGFDEWFGRAAYRDPAGRYQTMGEAVAQLRAVCGLRQEYGAFARVPASGADAPTQIDISASGAAAARTGPTRAFANGVEGMQRTAAPSAITVGGEKKRFTAPLVVLASAAVVLIVVVVGGVVSLRGDDERATAAPVPEPPAPAGSDSPESRAARAHARSSASRSGPDSSSASSSSSARTVVSGVRSSCAASDANRHAWSSSTWI